MITDIGKAVKFAAILTGSFIILASVWVFFQVAYWRSIPGVTTETELMGLVSKVRKDRGLVFELTDERKFRLPYAANHDYEPYSMWELLNQMDSIVKYSDSDTICVIRNNEEYLFVLGQTLNKGH